MSSCGHEHDHEGHDHGEKTAVVLYFVGLIAFLVAIFVSHNTLKTTLYITSLVLSGYHIILDVFLETMNQSMKEKSFIPNVNFLITFEVIGDDFIRDYMEAAIIMHHIS